MPCTPNIIPDPPSLGGGLSVPGLTPPGPPTLGACCQLPVLPPIPPIPPLPLPISVLVAAAAVLEAKLGIMSTWLESLPLKCPKS